MPTPKRYPNAAARQAAYRLRSKARREAASSPVPVPPRSGRRRWEAMCGQARCWIEQVSQEMEAYSEARSDAWQESERGDAFQETLETVTQIAEALTEVSFP